MANLLEAGYARDDIAIGEDGDVTVEGDIGVTLEASREMLDNGFRQFAFGAANQIDPSERAICFVVAEGSPLDDRKVTLPLQVAIKRWNEASKPARSSDWMFFGTAGHDCSTVVNVVNWGGSATEANDAFTSAYGQADIPSGGKPGQNLRVHNENIASLCAQQRVHLFVHEIGHLVGLRHTDFFGRDSCGVFKPEFGRESQYIPGTPEVDGWDQESVMNACLPSKTPTLGWGQFTTADTTAVAWVLGVRPAASE